MSRYAVHLCQIGCLVGCRHGHACMIYMVDRDHPHPTERGREHHYAYDFDTGEMHEWNGNAGRCRLYLPEDEKAEGEIHLTIQAGGT